MSAVYAPSAPARLKLRPFTARALATPRKRSTRVREIAAVARGAGRPIAVESWQLAGLAIELARAFKTTDDAAARTVLELRGPGRVRLHTVLRHMGQLKRGPRGKVRLGHLMSAYTENLNNIGLELLITRLPRSLREQSR